MSEPTDIEKKSLEAHVELCAERYRNLDNRLDDLNANISKLDSVIVEIRDMIHSMSDKRNSQIINWGVGIIGSLAALVAWLLATYVFK